jgi:cysteine-rich repeat protein
VRRGAGLSVLASLLAALALPGGGGAGAGAAAVAVVASTALTGCGPSCGNGEVESGEQCDDGNDNETDTCRACQTYAIPVTVLRWGFNDDPERGFAGDSCSDMGATTVRVELTGPAGVAIAPVDAECSGSQAVFADLPVGAYQAAFTPLDAEGTSLVTTPHVLAFEATSASATFDTIIPYTQWAGDYTGTFFFRITYDGGDCVAATPPVLQQRLRLRIDGDLYGGETETGQALNGSELAACEDASAEFPQTVIAAPFGPATFELEGLDEFGDVAFSDSFDTFIGAGVSNPPLTFALTNPDVTPDAALPDAAGAVDAAM